MFLLSLVGSSQSVFTVFGRQQSECFYCLWQAAVRVFLLSLVGSSQSVFTVFGRQQSECFYCLWQAEVRICLHDSTNF